MLLNDVVVRQEYGNILEYVFSKHKLHVRKCGLPYICHPLDVLSQLSEWEIDCYKCWKAAPCHDIREECPDVTHQEIISVIGPEAAQIVEELTFIPDLTNPIPVHVQKENYMKSFLTKSAHALVIKVADRCCNTRDFMKIDFEYARKYWKKANPLFDAMMSRGQEILDTFGLGSFPRMKYSRTLLNRELTR